VIGVLVVVGGVGFPVLQDLERWSRAWTGRFFRRFGSSRPISIRRRSRHTLSLHTQIVLTTTVILLVFGTVGLLLVEPHGFEDGRIGKHSVYRSDIQQEMRGERDWQNLSWPRKIRSAAFQSITARTAGFNTIDMNELSDSGKLWMCSLMVIGGSPASTAGGMKTATFALLIIAVWSMLRHRNDLEAFQRRITADLFRRGVTIAVLYVGLVFGITLLLSIALRDERFIDVLFEACSACGTVGLSTGVTNRLNLPGKGVIILGMFLGRIGPLTLLAALTSGLRKVEYEYATEDVTIG